MRRGRGAAGAVLGALLAGVLAPVTEHLGASLLDWSGQPWVAWPLFGLLCVLGGVLGTFVPLAPLERGGTGPDASPALTDPPTAPVAAGTATSLRPPRTGRHLRGRETERERLSALLRDPRGRYAVVCGAGGVGKTALAASVAARAEADGWSVFWIRWRDPDTLADDLVRAAMACGMPQESVRAARSGHDSLPDAVWRYLAGRRKWLVVVDNADETARLGGADEPVAHYRGWIRPDGRGLLLVTSRDTSGETWGPAADLLRLGPLDTVSGGRVLLDAAPGAGSREEAEALAARLGGLPLALQAASRYLGAATSRHRDFTACREALDREAELLIGADPPGARDPAVARTFLRHTWELSLDQLGSEGDHAAAADRYEHVLAQRHRVLGPDHPDTRASRQGLAVCRAERAAQGQDRSAPSRGTGRRGRARTRSERRRRGTPGTRMFTFPAMWTDLLVSPARTAKGTE